jgi:hypothetical protein
MDLARRIQAFFTRWTSSSILSPSVLMISGCILSSRTASFQSILGWNAANQGYPRMISSSPRSVTRNFMSSVLDPHRTWRSTKLVIVPALLWVPSMFQIALGFFRFRDPILNLFRSFVLMKLSVAPESTRTCLSALVCEDCKRVGIRKLLYLHAKTVFTPKVRAQAVGVAPLKNPCPHPRPPVPP